MTIGDLDEDVPNGSDTYSPLKIISQIKKENYFKDPPKDDIPETKLARVQSQRRDSI